ncbi:sterile alpha motif domain-containing protein 9-like [Megalops cyprinoides]|uniref:sterile alpha motif domain-containing protein 9-like n=1 Tax=Megalops cyprinoides TaxID=118141 RepID=UPI0018653F95|nr:sterile alpha motif domain-containing protein 9-like [Megalops cyprinoides]
MPTKQHELPVEIKKWTRDHVKEWVLKENLVNSADANLLYEQDICGTSLLKLFKSDLLDLGIKLGPAIRILTKRDELVHLKRDQKGSQGNQSRRLCKPYPFQRYHDAYRYKANYILDVTESGALDFIEPCHEFKAYINTEQASNENKMRKFTWEVIRFAAACMNSRTNGTIHFGVGDSPDYTQGEILGISIQDKEAFLNSLLQATEGHFEHKHTDAAKKCIKSPRFVEVLNPEMTSTEKYVIEVDIVPAYMICQDNFYHVYTVDKKEVTKKSKSKALDQDKVKEKCNLFLIRDGPKTKNLLVQSTKKKDLEEYSRFKEGIKQLSQQRREAEEKHLTDVKGVQGSRLSEMLTGGSQSLDNSRFERYLLVTNKSHKMQLESLEFLLEMNLTAVLDFDPESAENGLCKYYEEHRKINVHLPQKYKITEAVEDIADKLKLTRNTSWVLCSEVKEDNWFTEQAASVRNVISFLCRKDVLPQKRFLVVFLLLSHVSDKMDPLLEVLNIFWQELKGTDQILCICENKQTFTCWKDLIETRYDVDISARSIYELSLTEINGTVLSLWSENRRSSRFLPGTGAGKVILKKKDEECLDTLSILCVNQCEGGSEDMESLEQSFYKGGKVSWWNFYFSEQPGSMPFIKRDKYDFIKNTIIPELCSSRQACVYFNILHLPGCGGTTLAKHILWSLKDTYRCAVLKETSSNFAEVATQVVELLLYEKVEHARRMPVLLMLDDFEEMDDVFDLKQHVENEFEKRNLGSKCPQVILLNCMRTESWEQTEATEDTVFIGNNLSESEQKQFQKKLEEIEKKHKHVDTFYGFMIMKENFSIEYALGVAENTLKNFYIDHKHAQLIAVLTLLNVYCKSAALSVSLCEEFLELQTKPVCAYRNMEDEFEKFSTLVKCHTVGAKVVYEAVRLIHPIMAVCCLHKLTTTYGLTTAEIINLLLTNNKFYECTQGKYKLMKDVRSMLLKRHHFSKEENRKDVKDNMFSPVIQTIAKDTPGLEESVLSNAAKLFQKDAFICQLLSRYQYIMKKDFKEAKEWAKKAKDLAGDNSYISDTFAQIIKNELQNEINKSKGEVHLSPETLQEYLKLACSATDAFRTTQVIANNEIAVRSKLKSGKSPYNTAGHLGEIQVAVIITGILEKVPFFDPSNSVNPNILEKVLSGEKKIRDVSRDDQNQEHTPYYHVLEKFSDLFCNLKNTMKHHFNFLDSFFVNLEPQFSLKDIREERIRQNLLRCFHRYVELFCKSDVTECLKSQPQSIKNDIDRSLTFLEMNKADTHSGILDQLSKNSGEKMEEIVRTYMYILSNSEQERSVRNRYRINLKYANVVLACIKPESQCILPYKILLDKLREVLREPISYKDSTALHFIAVALLWTEQDSVMSYISQMKNSFRNEMGSVWYAKKPVVHFYLGQKPGYGHLLCRENIEKCIKSNSASLWENGMIWEHENVRHLLYRATGQVQKNTILADTMDPAVKIEIEPERKNQLCGKGQTNRVSFFIGFSMRGPLAFDIQFH